MECKNPTVSTVYCLIVSRVAFTYLAAALTAMCRVNVSVCSRGNQENLCLAWSGDQSIKEQLMTCLYFPYTKQQMCVLYVGHGGQRGFIFTVLVSRRANSFFCLSSVIFTLLLCFVLRTEMNVSLVDHFSSGFSLVWIGCFSWC